MLYTCNGADGCHHPHTKSPSLLECSVCVCLCVGCFFTSADGGQVGLREPPLCKLPRPHAAASASHWFLLRAQERCACESLHIIIRAFVPRVCMCVCLCCYCCYAPISALCCFSSVCRPRTEVCAVVSRRSLGFWTALMEHRPRPWRLKFDHQVKRRA